jgi:hypothetical protein
VYSTGGIGLGVLAASLQANNSMSYIIMMHQHALINNKSSDPAIPATP